MAARKPRIEYYWTTIKWASRLKKPTEHVVNWRLIGANGEVMCQSNQGFRDKTDAHRAVCAVAELFTVSPDTLPREVGPGRKPT